MLEKIHLKQSVQNTEWTILSPLRFFRTTGTDRLKLRAGKHRGRTGPTIPIAFLPVPGVRGGRRRQVQEDLTIQLMNQKQSIFMHGKEYPNPNYDQGVLLDFMKSNEKYKNMVQSVKNSQTDRIVIDLNDFLAEFGNQNLIRRIEQNTPRYIKIMNFIVDEMLKECVRNPELPRLDDTIEIYERVRVEKRIPVGYFRRYYVHFLPTNVMLVRPLRTIRSNFIGKMIRTQGIVCRASDVKCEIKFAVYLCDRCQNEQFIEVIDTSFQPIHKCKRCDKGGVFGMMSLSSRCSRFQNFQEIVIQEIPEHVPRGGIPKKTKVYCRGNLVRKCSPGDQIYVTGVFIHHPMYSVNYQTGTHVGTYVEGMDIRLLKRRYTELRSDEGLMGRIERIIRSSSPGEMYDRLAGSICPEIKGLDDVKKAILLQMVGGSPRRMSSGANIRGNIHVALVGDPGVGKSQLLKYISQVSPRSVYTTGRGSSSVGLTAAVLKDPTTGQYVLEGGALVLADRGICSIDEFDKMNELDFSSLHEVMEHETISVAKAGITTTLNARVSILCAANPQWGSYNKRKSVVQNINMPSALLSRFDLIFLLLDKNDRDFNLSLARHILNVHRTSGKCLHKDESGRDLLPVEFIKGYIAKAKECNPVVPKDKHMKKFIVDIYTEMRNQNGTDEIYGSTPRTLLSILRISQALAKIRFSNLISREDVMEAKRLMDSCKASLIQNYVTTGRSVKQNPKDIAFQVIKRYYKSNQVNRIPLESLQTQFNMRGITEQQVMETIEKYQNLGVWLFDKQENAIVFQRNL